MMKQFLGLLLILFANTAFAQRHDISLRPASTGHSGTGSNIDVKYHRFNWNINPDNSKNISGNVTTYFKTTQNNVNKITFDLNKTSFNNAGLVVKYHGTTCTTSFPSSGYTDILTITLPVTLPNNTLDSVTISYNGVPPAVSGQAEGCQQKTINGYPLFYTLSESYEDKDWWPCKADMQDKIDSTDYYITTPSKYTAAANGTLVSTTTSGSNKIYHYKHRYPIASYLVAVAVTQYDVFNRTPVNINGTLVPVVYYISKGRNPSSGTLNKFDYCRDELVAFSNLFGDYPFKNEKYGMYEFGWGGGMEHQTFSAMGWSSFNSNSTVAHELMHQWFGDKVTMATWNHLWLAEGFASYGEVLAGEFVPATGINPTTQRGSNKTAANGSTERTYSCYIPDASITNSNILWSSVYGSSVYDRGGMVVSMLRTLLGDDKFFQACRDYLSDPNLEYGSATTADLQAHMEAACGGFDLSGFFNSFVYGNGYPSYSGASAIQWDPIGGGKVRFRVKTPTKSSGSNVSTYYSVIPLRVQGAGGKDTLIVLYDQGSIGVSVGGDGIAFGNSPTPEVYVGFDPTSVTFDPYNMSLAVGTTTQTTVLATTIADFTVQEKNGQTLASLQLDDYSAVKNVTLERSTDGIQFSSTGVMAQGLNGNYTYSELSTNRLTYYRARVELQTGELIYSVVAKVSGDPDMQNISLLTNPVTDIVRVRIPNGNNSHCRYAIADMSGRTLFRSEKQLSGDLLEINLSNRPPGSYLLQIQSRTGQKTLQFVIK